jgi:fructosamine-3-kinase
MPQGLERAIARATGSSPSRMTPMGGGCIAQVYKVALENGRTIVAKVGDGGLALEGKMLEYLADHLPVPAVILAEDGLLLMEHLDSGSPIDDRAETHAADLLARLHGVTADRFGFGNATLIGGLHQPNDQGSSWLDFFRDHRLLYMGAQAVDAGRLPGPVLTRLESLAGRLDKWLAEPERPSLIHGDMWGGNVLCRSGRISGFVDPAIYYADPEIELAFSTLFGTFGDAFFGRYREIRPLAPGFLEERRDLYNLYPLLVHVRLFGGHYVGQVERTLGRFGF